MFWAPLGWLLLLAAVFLNGLLFWAILNNSGGNITYSLQYALGGGEVFWGIMVFLPPLLSMRLLAEEARTGTLEYLFTSPVSDASVILGKYLAAATFMAILWLSVLFYGACLHWAGHPPDWTALITAYVGAILVSSVFISISFFAGSFTSSPLLAAFLGTMACTFWLMAPGLVDKVLTQLRDVVSQWTGGWTQAESWIQGAVRSMDVAFHFMRSFLTGVLDSAELVFFVTWPALFLFLTIRSLEARRWKV